MVVHCCYSAVGSLYRVDVGSISDVSDVCAASNFWVEVRTVGYLTHFDSEDRDNMYLRNVRNTAHIYSVYMLLISEHRIMKQWKEEGERNGYREMTGMEKDRMLQKIKEARKMRHSATENDKAMMTHKNKNAHQSDTVE
jgi:hypothetical protein